MDSKYIVEQSKSEKIACHRLLMRSITLRLSLDNQRVLCLAAKNMRPIFVGAKEQNVSADHL